MRTVAVLQARTGSTRLPGKVLMDLWGAPVVARCLERLRRCSTLDEIVLATTTEPRDDGLVGVATELGLPYYRGSEHDVLRRYYEAASEQHADIVVRVTADCPLLMPDVVDRVVRALPREMDFASNALATNRWPRTFPRGLDAEAMHFDVLRRVHRMAMSAPAREHVTWLIYRERPDLFAIHSVAAKTDHSSMSWTLDDHDDLVRLRHLWPLIGDTYVYAEALERLELGRAA